MCYTRWYHVTLSFGRTIQLWNNPHVRLKTLSRGNVESTSGKKQQDSDKGLRIIPLQYRGSLPKSLNTNLKRWQRTKRHRLTPRNSLKCQLHNSPPLSWIPTPPAYTPWNAPSQMAHKVTQHKPHSSQTLPRIQPSFAQIDSAALTPAISPLLWDHKTISKPYQYLFPLLLQLHRGTGPRRKKCQFSTGLFLRAYLVTRSRPATT